MSGNYRVKTTLISLLLLLNGCIGYVPNVTQVSAENLPEYNPKHFQNLYDQKSKIENEDSLIIQALCYEQKGDLAKSHAFYSQLYDLTGNEEYLLREVGVALYIGKTSKNIHKLESWVATHPNNVKAMRILISSYLNDKAYDKAKQLSKSLLQVSTEPIDYELAANPYILTQEYKKAINLLDEAYKESFNSEILIKIATLYANYLEDIESAIARLENHRRNYECDERICYQLIEIYTKQEKIDKLMDVYRELYDTTKNDQYAEKIVQGYMYQKEVDKAITFLEHDYENDPLLYELYLIKKLYAKAQQTAEKLYHAGLGPRWLAESAMALYESSPDKNDRTMILSVINKLAKAIQEGANEPTYLNYYGYTLIDYDIDVEKGLAAVEEALKSDSTNSYFRDSLAWGYYKSGECQRAYDEMRQVVDAEGLDEPEIADHWIKIKACIKE